MFIQDLSGRRGSGGSLGRVYLWRRPAKAAARAVWGALQVRWCGFETRSAGRGQFWPKGRRRTSRVRISMAPCSEGDFVGRGWRSPGQHLSFSTPGAYFQFAHSLRTGGHGGVLGLSTLVSGLLSASCELALRAELRLLVLLRSVRDLCPRRTRVAALTLTALCTQ